MEMDECDAKKKERMAKAAAKKKTLAEKEEAVDSKPAAEGSERRACLQARLRVPFGPVLD